MAGINLLSENHFLTASLSLTTGTENAQFPLTNTQNDSPSIKFRSDGNTVVMEIDLLQTRAIDTLSLVADPTDSFGVTAATYKTSVTTDFSGSPVNTIDLYPAENMGLSYITEVSHRYVEITFTGQGSYVEVGHVFIGKRVNLPQNNISVGSFAYDREDRSRIRQNRYGQKFIDELPQVKSLGGEIEFCTKEEQETIDTIYRAHGKNKPLWLIIDKDGDAITDGESKLSLYGYFESNPSWSAVGGQLYNTSLTVREAI